jgi:uncharacterized protein (DUF433 family)
MSILVIESIAPVACIAGKARTSQPRPFGWINPLVRFGMPAVRGISIEAIAGELDGGAYLEQAADDFGLDLDAVRWAHSYELSQRAAA